VDQCPSCQETTDGTYHSYFECPIALDYWRNSITTLMQFIAPIETSLVTNLAHEIEASITDTKELLFGFPGIRKRLNLGARIVSWHAIITAQIWWARYQIFTVRKARELNQGQGEKLIFTEYSDGLEMEMREWCMRDAIRIQHDRAFHLAWPTANRHGKVVTFTSSV
jgi:hypothetical protein